MSSNTVQGLNLQDSPLPWRSLALSTDSTNIAGLRSGNMNKVANFSALHGIQTWSCFEAATSTFMTEYTCISISGRILKHSLLKVN